MAPGGAARESSINESTERDGEVKDLRSGLTPTEHLLPQCSLLGMKPG